jgi:hypothetical protein
MNKENELAHCVLAMNPPSGTDPYQFPLPPLGPVQHHSVDHFLMTFRPF